MVFLPAISQHRASLGACILTPDYQELPDCSAWQALLAALTALRGGPTPPLKRLLNVRSGRTIVAWFNQDTVVPSFIVVWSGPSPEHGAMPSVEYLMMRLRPIRVMAREGLKAIQAEEAAIQAIIDAQAEAKRDWIAYMRKRDPALANAVERGIVPFSADPLLPGDAADAWSEVVHAPKRIVH